MKISSILGLNARGQLFSYPYNTSKGRRTAASKILSGRALRRIGVPTPKIYKVFRDPSDIFNFNWEKLPDAFAVKPSKGLGGDGIIVVKTKGESEGEWITTSREKIRVEDIKLHILDIMEGAYSMGNVPDVAFIQEYVGRHNTFVKFAYRGTPDIRIIVFNKIPVMAMLRLPTKESGGRANLHQGAIGVGIDIATGITTRAVWHGKPIKFKPGTKKKLNGIKIPQWTKILETAARCTSIGGLGYMGVDIVMHPTEGPMVLELNSQPGLQIQLANMAGLRKRLDRVEDLEVVSAEQGVNIAKALFAERFADRVKAQEGIKTIRVWEVVRVVGKDKEKVSIVGKIDTGAWRTSIDKELAERLGLMTKDNIVLSKRFKSGLGQETRNIIGVTFYLAGRKISTLASVANRSKLKAKIIIGRRDLEGFLIQQIDGNLYTELSQNLKG